MHPGAGRTMIEFVLDENIPRALYLAVVRYNRGMPDVTLDVVAVGMDGVPAKNTPDGELLVWAATNGRILVTYDCHTMQPHLDALIESGVTSPGVLVLRNECRAVEFLDALRLIAHAGSEDDFKNLISWIPY
jgi:hypothetical protein